MYALKINTVDTGKTTNLKMKGKITMKSKKQSHY